MDNHDVPFLEELIAAMRGAHQDTSFVRGMSLDSFRGWACDRHRELAEQIMPMTDDELAVFRDQLGTL